MNTYNSLRLAVPKPLSDPLSGLFMELGAEGIWEDGPELVAYFPNPCVLMRLSWRSPPG